MRNPLHNDEFEELLQQVNHHRMYPSDKIWRNIQSGLHGEGTWPALTYISIFIITALVVGTLMVKPEERLTKNIAAYPVQTAATILEKNNSQQANAAEAAPVQYAYTDNITQQTIQSVNKTITEHSGKTNHLLPSSATDDATTATEKLADETALYASAAKPSPKQNLPATVTSTALLNEEKTEETTIGVINKPASRYFSTIGLMDLSNLKATSSATSSSFSNNEIENWRTYPLLSTRDLLRKKLSKFSFQFYITPSVSYRRLNDANGKTAKSYTVIPMATSYVLDINHIVEHRPSMGAEVGFALGYKLSNSLTVKGGLQFNVRQYSIKAYTMSPQPNEARGAIQSVNEIMANEPVVQDSTASYLTSAAYAEIVSKPVVLNNRYYEIAAPIGIDWRVLSARNGNLSFNVAASVQPTYTFDKEPFVITTNYKSYADGTSLMRNWNINSNVEAYISYRIGPFRWQLGPQFRYQHLSTYSNTYPIREHLLDYGVKLGFTKSLY